MKARLLTALCVLAMTFVTVTPSVAMDKPTDMIADVVVVRPSCFIATIIGSAFFVVALPVAAMSKSVKQAAHTLVVKPARATFTRPLGDFTDLQED